MGCVPRFLCSLARRGGRRLGADEKEVLTQDVLVQVVKGLRLYRGEASLETWVFPFCRRRFRRHADERDGADPGGNPDGAILDVADPASPEADPERELEHLLRHLTEREREVVVRLVVYRFTYEEAAQALGVTPATIRTLWDRARTKLRDILPPEDEPPEKGGEE